ncbi:hypothetical protein O181_044001, partial [Austropuccinia psidii MF-1]|nr:hypothetical protein [Austropuccinia psidii MF-1]
MIIRPMKDGDGKRTFELGPVLTLSCHQWDSNTKTLPFLVCLASKTCGNPLQARVAPDGRRNYSAVSSQKPSQTKEPPIPGPSPSSEPPEDIPTREPEPEVAPMQSTEEAF